MRLLVNKLWFATQYLMEHVSWYGPVYLEASRLEEKRNELGRAIEIVQRGLTEMPKYGPLWFRYTLFCLYAQLSIIYLG